MALRVTVASTYGIDIDYWGITFQFDGENWIFGDGSGNLMRLAYDKIKTMPPFTGATEEA